MADSALDRALFDATRSGDAKQIIRLLEAGADPNYAILEASTTGGPEIVAMLLDAGADPDWTGPDSGRDAPRRPTPLAACLGATVPMDKSRMFWKHNPATLDLLLERGADPNLGKPLIYAFGSPAWDKLRAAGAVIDQEIATAGMIWSATQGRTEDLEEFLSAPVPEESLQAALGAAAAAHQEAALRVLLEHGANLNQAPDHRNPLVRCLAHSGRDADHIGFFNELRYLGAGLTPELAVRCLMTIAANHFLDLMDFRFLVDADTPLTQLGPDSYRTPLDRFKEPRHQKFLQWLVDQEYISDQDCAAITLLDKVSHVDQDRLPADIQSDIVDNRYHQRDIDRALMTAILAGRLSIAAQLVAAGADFRQRLAPRFMGWQLRDIDTLPLVAVAIQDHPNSRSLVSTLLNEMPPGELSEKDQDFVRKRALAFGMTDLFD